MLTPREPPLAPGSQLSVGTLPDRNPFDFPVKYCTLNGKNKKIIILCSQQLATVLYRATSARGWQHQQLMTLSAGKCPQPV